jgi:hypothetical protein
MHLLGRVDEQEEQREGSRGAGGTADRQCVDPLEQGRERRRIGVPVPARPGGLPQRLHGLEGRLPLEPANHLAERGREEAHVLVERENFVAGRGRSVSGQGSGVSSVETAR